jgi:glyoxylase-like metal-dependent hydrolase (beta-lactamase superfamily II)
MIIRPFLRAALAVTLGLSVVAGGAQAAAPLSKVAAPGYYRVILGDFEVTALSDGTVELPVNTLLNSVTPPQVDQMLAKSYLKSPLETSFNAFLINTGSKLILIDTGAGSLFGPTVGRLVRNLQAAGYQPEQVDEIYITHMHGDHVGGLMADGKIVFPNAIVRADKREADYRLSQANLDKAPAARKASFQGAMASVGPYVAAGKFKPFDGDTDLTPGIKAVATHGHTPGHTSYLVESRGQKLLVWGDLVHVASVQFGRPDITISFDDDSKAGIAQRQKIYADAAENAYLIAAAHVSFPGIGRLRANGKHFEWLPVNYSIPH